jgi:hypothetical protein
MVKTNRPIQLAASDAGALSQSAKNPSPTGC